ncbi:MAG: 50S ribosomal protein L22 [Candidatus Woesearchaeota archaeon]
MTTYRYTSQIAENEARAVGVAMPVSYKQSYEVAKFIRGKSVQAAKKMLEDVIALRRPVPMTRFNRDTGHKPGMAAGRFTINTCTHILKLLKSAESNAQFKGLSTANLVVRHIAAQKGPTSFRYGRHRRRQAKRAHVEIIVAEQKEAPKKERSKKEKAESKQASEPKAAAEKKAPAQKEQPKNEVSAK